jgi:hypothetical protein
VQGSSEVREILAGEAKAKYEACKEAHENKKAHESEDIRR